MTSDELIVLFENYKTELKDNPITIHDFVGKDGDSAYRKRSRLLSMAGFRAYGRRNGVILKKLIGLDETFEAIADEIFAENIEGAAAGAYSPSIVQRLHGLSEQVEQTNLNKTIEVQMDLGNENKIQEASVIRLSK